VNWIIIFFARTIETNIYQETGKVRRDLNVKNVKNASREGEEKKKENTNGRMNVTLARDPLFEGTKKSSDARVQKIPDIYSPADRILRSQIGSH